MFVYIHIPFCNNICKYCDFPKLLYDKRYVNKYLDSLEKEIDSRYKGEEVVSIFIGGGTPTSLGLDELRRLLDITTKFNTNKLEEFTIESNVDSLNKDKILLMKEFGVNRVSLGVQSFNDEILKELNRVHTKEDVFRVVNDIKSVGIENISIDYIYGVNNDINVIKEDIDTFLKLDIPHISCYSLIIEDNTVFGIERREYIDQDIEYEMYKYISNRLEESGYIHYEVSNYGKDGYMSIHNINYWNNGYYYGFGMGSVSYLDDYRISNTKNLSKYMDGCYVQEEVYEEIDIRISNGLVLGLRKVNGINIEEFNKRYNTDILGLYNIKNLIKEEKLVIKDGYIFINKKYFYMSNDILINFV